MDWTERSQGSCLASWPNQAKQSGFWIPRLPPPRTTMPGPAPAKPTSLAKALAHLTKQPQPKLSPKLRSLSLTFAKRNAHYGARHFVKEDLPRIAYSHPNLKISVERKEHLRESPWAPELRAEFGKHGHIHSELICVLTFCSERNSRWDKIHDRYDQKAFECNSSRTPEPWNRDCT